MSSERTVTVMAAEGLHARPAAAFVKLAKRFAADILVLRDDRQANAKSTARVMTLGARKGDKVTIRADGEDAEEAVRALCELIADRGD